MEDMQALADIVIDYGRFADRVADHCSTFKPIVLTAIANNLEKLAREIDATRCIVNPQAGLAKPKRTKKA